MITNPEEEVLVSPAFQNKIISLRQQISDKEAEKILESNLPGVILSKHFGVSPSAVSLIRQGNTFKHVLEKFHAQ